MTRSPLPPESERQFMAAIVQLAKALGWRTYHSWSSLHSAAGFPDLVLCHAGQRRLLFVEVKRAGGRLRPEQQPWLHDLGQCRSVESFLWRAGENRVPEIAEILKGTP